MFDGSIENRARMHAALGEPVRLAIVDQLALGDASPGELGAAVDVPTNLLAHHLKVLEEARLIRRVRSEGDRRRSYVQLCWGDPAVADLLGSPAGRPPGLDGAGDPTRVVFVCTHNSARSQLAAAVWSQVSAVPAASAGTPPAERVHPRAVAVARRHVLDLARARPRPIGESLGPRDLIVAVCDNAHEELVATRPEGQRRGWLHWAVPDPVRLGTDDAFAAAYADVAHRVQRLAGALAGVAPGRPDADE